MIDILKKNYTNLWKLDRYVIYFYSISYIKTIYIWNWKSLTFSHYLHLLIWKDLSSFSFGKWI